MATFKLQKFAHFNRKLHPFPIAMPKRSGGTCILVDRSHSMTKRTRELEAVMTDLRRKCGATTAEMPTPVPGGSTALADCAHKFAKRLKTATFLVVTDGDDTSSHRHFSYAKPKAYKKTWKKTKKGGYRPSERWLTNKRERVLDFLEKTLKAKIVLLGMGDGAKKLIRAASRKGRRINCAYIADGDKDVDITKIMDAACAEATRNKGTGKTRVITANSVNNEADEDYWDIDDSNLEGFLDDEKEAVESSDDDEEEDDEDIDDSDDDSDASTDAFCDDSDDDSPKPRSSDKRSAPVRASARAAKTARKTYYQDSDSEEEEE